MKKLFALVICIAMIACVAVTASADAVKATFNINTVSGAKVGDTVLVKMDIAERGTRIGAIGFDFIYDTTYLEFVMNEDEGKYFVVGLGAGGAIAAGNENTMEVQLATASGFFIADTVITLAFKVIKDIPVDHVVRVDAKVIMEPKSAVDENTTYDVTINAGGVMSKAGFLTGDPSIVDPPIADPPIIFDPPFGPPVGIDGASSTTQPVETIDKTNPETGDAAGIAVAAGLCAVMAAAFVIVKKLED